MRLVPTLVASALLASCGSGDETSVANEVVVNAAGEGEKRVMCALKGADRFERKCVPEWTEGGEGRVLVLRAPDGGFRRLLLTRDGRGLIAADGAEPAVIGRYNEGLLEVSIGSDRYRLPQEFEASGP